MERIRITPKMPVKEGLEILRRTPGCFITNTARDVSQSDFKNRILPHTDFLVAPGRNAAGFFSLEITGGASVHVDLLRRQINPFTRLEILRRLMPDTMFQTLCRGVNLFGYRPYPENVIRATVRAFARYVEVWRVFDFLNHVPNIAPVLEEVQKAGKYAEPGLCFSTGPEHTDEFYVGKVREILEVSGPDIILGIKNHSGVGTPRRIYSLISAIKEAYPDLIIHYHGHNTDGNDIGRIVAAVKAGAKIVDAGDHALTGFFGPPPMLSAILTLQEEGVEVVGIDMEAIIEVNEELKRVRPAYAAFESQFKGFDPTVHIHKLPGGATGSSFEQAVKGGFLHRMPEIVLRELPRVHVELGNFWSVTPGSQILWTTSVNHVLSGERYTNASDDLKRLLLERYGPFPFRRPADEIYRAVFGPEWKRMLATECGQEECPEIDLDTERKTLEKKLGRPVSEEELILYVQHPRDAEGFFLFEQEYGKTFVLPPEVWFREGGFESGEIISFEDYTGKHHQIIIGPTQPVPPNGLLTYLLVDHNPEPFITRLGEEKNAPTPSFTAEQLALLAEMGEIRARAAGVVVEVCVQPGQKVAKGDTLLVMESMKMLSTITTPKEGVVKEIGVKVSQQVARGDLLMTIAGQ